MLHTSQYFVTD